MKDWSHERWLLREFNLNHTGKPSSECLSSGISLISYDLFSMRSTNRNVLDQVNFLQELAPFPSLLQQSPTFRFVYDRCRTSADWNHIKAEDGHMGVPPRQKVPIFGQTGATFPLKLFEDSIDGIHDVLLPEMLGFDRADGSTFDVLWRVTAARYRSTWRAHIKKTLDMVRQCIETGRSDWGEPNRLGDLGVIVNFVAYNCHGILSLLPPHIPHPLPPNVITPFTIIPFNRIVQSHRLRHIHDPIYEALHLRFSVSPPGMFTRVRPSLPVNVYIWNHVGFTLWLLYPPTNFNMEAWYGTPEYHSSHTIAWAADNLKGLRVGIAGPWQRMRLPRAYFYATLSLTPTVQSALEFITHDDLFHVLRLQKERLGIIMERIRKGHKDPKIMEELYSWREGLDERFLKPFRTQWKEQWDLVVQRLDADLKAEEDYEEGDEKREFIFDDKEF